MKRHLRSTMLGPLIASMLLLGGCASSGSQTGSSTGALAAATDSSAARADADLAPYTGHPSAFPVTAPLVKKLPPGSTIAFMDCGTPVCALFRQLVTPAARAMGVKLDVIRA